MLEKYLIPPLVQHFEQLDYIVCTEYRTPWAIPDILAVLPSATNVQRRIAKGQLAPLGRELYWEILDLIPDIESGRSVHYRSIAETLGISPNHLRSRLLRGLVRNGYIRVVQDQCVKVNGFHPYCEMLISVEAKIKDWRRAGEQAQRHQRFVNQAFVALPSRFISPAKNHAPDFERANIGLLEITDDGAVHPLVLPRPHEPRVSAMYYTALDFLWLKVQASAIVSQTN